MSARESIIPVFVPHLGCPHNCVFCNQNRISGQLEPATPQTVIDEIENAAAFLPKGGKRQLAFYGGSFTAIPAAELASGEKRDIRRLRENKQRLLAAWEKLYEENRFA